MGNQSIYTADSFCLCINKTRFAMATEMVQKAMDNEAENTKPVQDDTKPVQDDTKPVQDDAKPVQDDAKPVQDDAKDTKRVKGDKKRKNSNASSAVEKKGKKTMPGSSTVRVSPRKTSRASNWRCLILSTSSKTATSPQIPRCRRSSLITSKRDRRRRT